MKSPRAVHAQAALRETVTMMSGCIVEEASITVPILGSHLSEDDIVLHPHIAASLRAALGALRAAVAGGVELNRRVVAHREKIDHRSGSGF